LKIKSLVLILSVLLPLISTAQNQEQEKPEPQLIQIITLPNLSESGANELLNAIKGELGSINYRRQGISHDKLSEIPENVNRYDTYVKKSGKQKKVVRFGVIKYLTRPSRMWIEAVVLEGSEATYNSDIEVIVKTLNEEVIEDLRIKDELTQSKSPARLVTLPQLSMVQQYELLNSFKLAISLNGYNSNNFYTNPSLTPVPQGLEHSSTLISSFNDKTRVIRFGIISFSTLPSKLWIESLEFTKDGKTLLNSELDQIVAILNEQIIPDISEKTYVVENLSKEIIHLSHASSDEAIMSLKAQGMTAYQSTDDIPKSFSFDELPVILEMPEPTALQTGLVGEGPNKDSLTVATRLSTETVSSRLSKLLVIYHPDHLKQLESVKRNITTLIDKAARQVLIEGMVLEIKETGLMELGAEWGFSYNNQEVGINGGTPTDGVAFTASLDGDLNSVNDIKQLVKNWNLKIDALVKSGKAEILSRPSVLTLDNRQATIRVGEDEPIAKTTTTDNSTSTSFEYLATGILLNVRPQISEDGDVVSLAIDTTVSQIGETVYVKDPTDSSVILAQAPRVSTRRVQTYATITNNTPFIIGGLISRDQNENDSSLPILGDLPYIGKLFSSRSDQSEKREVIIMLTPYVLPEEDMSRTTPKDDELFDSVGNNLFRSSYRMKKSDLTDLSFLTENPRVKEFRNIAQKLADYGSPLAEEEPFSQFVNGKFPGEKTIVQKIIYSLITKQGIENELDLNQMKFFKQSGDYGFKETDLMAEIAKIQRYIPEEEYTWWEKILILLKIRTEDAIKDKYKENGLALALTYTANHDSIDMKTIFNEPVPAIQIVECTDRDDWQKQLRELNKQNQAGQTRYTILINNQEDLTRLKAAVMMKEIVLQNGGIDELDLSRLEAGKQLLLPDFKKGQDHIIDSEVARYFVASNFYYPKLIHSVETALSELINSLQKLFLHTNYTEHGLTREQLSKIGLATPIDIYLKANRPTTSANYSVFSPVIDGKFNDAIWHTTDVLSEFVEKKTRNISKLTEAKVAYDDVNLYLAMQCHEPFMDKIVADTEVRDANLNKDDCITLAIDTNSDRKSFFQFTVNTNNALTDFRVDGEPDINYSANISSAIHKTKDGWSVEMAIPWRDLDVKVPTSKTRMGLLLYRNRAAVKEKHQYPFLNGSNNRVDFYGDLIFK